MLPRVFASIRDDTGKAIDERVLKDSTPNLSDVRFHLSARPDNGY